ncbi:helix-turn-helix domain-containing protein [Candidatus Dojkabacteria bacterium]|nr:helix-turn-helix domain-containing protein [Candidatus Dojkabacteria bacterium]
MLTPGQILQKRRTSLRKSLSQVSLETKIQEKYLKLLESEEYSQFDSNVFISGFIKIYSEYLGLDVNKMLALYRRSDKALKEHSKDISITKRKKLKFDFKKLITPVNVIILLAIVILSVFIVSTVDKYNQLNEKPTIVVTSPKNNEATESDKVTIKGQTDKGNLLHINDEKIVLKRDGSFEKIVALKLGENIFTITSENPDTETKNTKTIRVERKLVEEKVVKPVEQVKPTTFSVYVEIAQEATWIQLSVDDQQKIAQALLPGKSAVFTMKESLDILTGKPSITKLFVNGKEIALNVNSSSGTASLSCTIQDNELNCPR